MPKSLLTHIIIGLGIIGLLILCYMLIEPMFIRVTTYTIQVANLPEEFEGYTILHMTDLHGKDFGRDQKRLLRVINQQSYDLIALTGDMIDRHESEIQPSLTLIEQLKQKPIFYVPGNHELKANYDQVLDMYRVTGIEVLDNRSYQLKRGDAHLWIIGVEDPYTGRDRFDLALKEVTDQQAPRILLAHAPSALADAIQADIDLMLVGHTHAGQVRFPLIGAVIAPGQGLFPKYDYGRFKVAGTEMIISAGLGESQLPIRLLNLPEIVLITLSRE